MNKNIENDAGPSRLKKQFPKVIELKNLQKNLQSTW